MTNTQLMAESRPVKELKSQIRRVIKGSRQRIAAR